MKYFAILILLVACGEKRNPDRCCVDEADCAAIGLPNGSTCQPGELCRGNECVEQTCSMSSQCDLAAPYCESGHCAEMCTSDTSCPVTSPEKPFCVSGGCVQCRETSDCGDLVCRNGSCGTCATDGECASGLCVTATGTCADQTNVAFVAANGSSTSNCTKADPCTLSRGLSITPAREILSLAEGQYQQTGTVVLQGKRTLAGINGPTTQVTNIAAGPVFSVETGADVTMSQLKIFGATSGVGINCSGAMLHLNDLIVTGNSSHGLSSVCTLTVQRSTFSANGGRGITSGTGGQISVAIDRVLVTANGGGGVDLFGGTIKNSFVFRNTGDGLLLHASLLVATAAEFNTVAANTGSGVVCLALNKNPTVSNCLVANHGADFLDTNCTQSGNLTSLDAQTAGMDFQFKSPTTAPFDYHLNAGSYAINRASGGSGMLDFDGELRPKGVAADVGADEAF